MKQYRGENMKIAILVNEDTANRCTGSGCLRAFFSKVDAFEGCPNDAELIGFTHVGGELDKKINRLIEKGVDTIHLSSCIRSKYASYESLANRLSEHFNVVGYTHGKSQGKTTETVSIKKRV